MLFEQMPNLTLIPLDQETAAAAAAATAAGKLSGRPNAPAAAR